MSWFHGIRRDERGATSLEYAIMASLIAAVIVGAVEVLGQTALALFESFTSQFNG